MDKEAGTSVTEIQIDPQREAALLRKLDTRIIPVLSAIYFLSFLDRNNIGNAAISNMPDNLIGGNRLSTLVSCVYATYCVFELFMGVLAKRFSARRMLCIGTSLWGLISFCQAFTRNSYGALVFLRLALGAAEATFFPTASVFIVTYYKREEQARRWSYIFVASACSGAFSGLIAYGIQHISAGKWESWQYLFAIEGGMSLVAAPIVYLLIPERLEQAWFLTSEDREIVQLRYSANLDYERIEPLSRDDVKQAFGDIKIWVSTLYEFLGNLTLYGFSTFIPIIIKGMGFTSVRAQLMTVPVYSWAAIAYIVGAHMSDRMRRRGVFLIAFNTIACVAYVLLISIPTHHLARKRGSLVRCLTRVARYFSVFVLATSAYAITSLNLTWQNNNISRSYKRGTPESPFATRLTL